MAVCHYVVHTNSFECTFRFWCLFKGFSKEPFKKENKSLSKRRARVSGEWNRESSNNGFVGWFPEIKTCKTCILLTVKGELWELSWWNKKQFPLSYFSFQWVEFLLFVLPNRLFLIVKVSVFIIATYYTSEIWNAHGLHYVPVTSFYHHHSPKALSMQCTQQNCAYCTAHKYFSPQNALHLIVFWCTFRNLDGFLKENAIHVR